ncbi:hypothetical protein H1D32_13405 [Anaerobacillus sp. CMMVII]|uniref:hypothetical protein n=1 Tax=Anaerobacillus sp. CMMVII TaxID=2755588 RepID=UPI0021B6E7F7|nr:hypothetical protein [Anaerobacillus sp. CMMVII]MCT8138651.1 hypothetical protein [Anaerobacillus sp. CMMVII]
MMNKIEITQIFNELLEEYRLSTETVIDNMGNLDHSYLEEEIKNFRRRFEEALND